jgi:hypothetical protein
MMCAPPERSRIEGTPIKGEVMWWVFGGLAAFLYIVLIITLGVKTLQNGHWVMFIAGIFLPLFWIIGALMTPTGSPGRQPA